MLEVTVNNLNPINVYSTLLENIRERGLHGVYEISMEYKYLNAVRMVEDMIHQNVDFLEESNISERITDLYTIICNNISEASSLLLEEVPKRVEYLKFYMYQL